LSGSAEPKTSVSPLASTSMLAAGTPGTCVEGVISSAATALARRQESDQL
jgi:hypothetical protein